MHGVVEGAITDRPDHPPVLTSRNRVTAATIAGGLALVTAWVLRGVLWADPARLPGLDAPIHYAWETYTRFALAQGQLPHWNPYLFGGTPHLADVQMLLFYPPAMLLRWVPIDRFFESLVALHVWIGGVGALWLARVLGLGWPAAAVAAVGIMLGGSLAPWLYHGHLLIVLTTAWAPWTLAAAIVSVRRRSWLPHPLLVVVTAMQLLAGYPQGSLYIGAIAAAFYAYTLVWPGPERQGTRTRAAAQLVGLCVLAGGLAAIQLLPFLQFSREVARTAGRAYSFAVQDSWSFRDVAMVFFPFVGGGTSAAPYRSMLDGVYVGWLTTLLVPFAFLRREHRRMAIFCAVLTLGAIAFALGDNLPFYRLHYLLFPGLRVPGRLLFVARLGLALLGAFGLDALITLIRRRETRRLVPAAAVSVAACAAAIVVARPALAASGLPLTHGWPWLPVGMVTALALAAVAARSFGIGPLIATAVIVIGVDVALFASGGVETVPSESAATVRRWVSTGDDGSVWPLCGRAISGTGLLTARYRSIDGPEGLYLRDYREWLDVLIASANEDSIGSGRAMADLAGVSVILSCGRLEAPALSLVNRTRDLWIYRNDAAAPRAFWSCTIGSLPRREIAARLRIGQLDDVRDQLRFVSIRWTPGTTDVQRERLEQQYHLADGVFREGTTWRYALDDSSPENIRALVSDPAVDDTSGFDRGSATWQGGGDPRADAVETLAIPGGCAQAASVSIRERDRPDGYMRVDVNAPAAGVLVLNEPYYGARRAYVDGRAVAPMKTNLAFMAVPLGPGAHRVELRLALDAFHAGAAITVVTGIIWGVLLVIGRRRRGASASPAAPVQA